MNSTQRNIVAAILVAILVLGVFITLSAAQEGRPDPTVQALTELKSGQDAQTERLDGIVQIVSTGFDRTDARLTDLEGQVATGDKATQDKVDGVGTQVSDLSADEAVRDEMTQSKLDSIQEDTGIIRRGLQSVRDDLLEPMYRRLQDLWNRTFGPKPKASRSTAGGSAPSAPASATSATTLPAGNVPHTVNTVETVPDPAVINDNEPVHTEREPDGPFPTSTTLSDGGASTTTTTTEAPTTTSTTLDPPPATGDEGNEPSTPVTLESVGS